MKHSFLIAVSVVAVALSACNKKAEEPAEDTSSIALPAEETTAPAASPSQLFVDAAAASDAFEIETSKLAATNAQSASVKTFAEHMIKAHTESMAKLKTAAASVTPAITPRLEPTPEQQKALAELKIKTGAEFDRAYAAAQTKAHTETLDALKAYAANGDVPSLKGFATELLPVVTAHLNMAKGL